MNKSTKPTEIVGLDALRKQLELNLLMQSPTNLHQFLTGLNSFGNYNTQGKYVQMYGSNGEMYSQQNLDNSVAYRPEYMYNKNWFNQDIFRNYNQEPENLGQSEIKDSNPPTKVGDRRLNTDSLNSFTATNGEIDQMDTHKLNSAFKTICNSNIATTMTKPKSFSLDSQTTAQVDSHSDLTQCK